MSESGRPFIVKFGEQNPEGLLKFARLEFLTYDEQDQIKIYQFPDRECARLYGLIEQKSVVTLVLFLKDVKLLNTQLFELKDLTAWTATAVSDYQRKFSKRIVHS